MAVVIVGEDDVGSFRVGAALVACDQVPVAMGADVGKPRGGGVAAAIIIIAV